MRGSTHLEFALYLFFFNDFGLIDLNYLVHVDLGHIYLKYLALSSLT